MSAALETTLEWPRFCYTGKKHYVFEIDFDCFSSIIAELFAVFDYRNK